MARTSFALDTFVRLWNDSGTWSADRTAYVFNDYTNYSEVKYWAQILDLQTRLTGRGRLEVEACPEVTERLSP